MAIAIATVLVAAGLSVVPPAAALTADCDEDFDIADSETTASLRPLDAGVSEVGHEEVLSTADEELTVRLETSGDELTFEIFEETSNGCVQYTGDADCKGENVLDNEDEEKVCTLNAPSSGNRDFFVVYKNTEDSPADQLEHMTWVDTI
jgi:hypothetical protein